MGTIRLFAQSNYQFEQWGKKKDNMKSMKMNN